MWNTIFLCADGGNWSTAVTIKRELAVVPNELVIIVHILEWIVLGVGMKSSCKSNETKLVISNDVVVKHIFLS